MLFCLNFVLEKKKYFNLLFARFIAGNYESRIGFNVKNQLRTIYRGRQTVFRSEARLSFSHSTHSLTSNIFFVCLLSFKFTFMTLL